jgi:outer membrane protein OmpA-like peptidoglycan-associated protein
LKNQGFVRVISKQKIIIALFTILLMGGCAAHTPELSPSVAMAEYQSVNELNVQLKKAQKTGIPYLAPEGYQEAQMIYTSALDKAMAQDAEAAELAQNGLERLRIAIKQAGTSRTLMLEALDTRAKALNAAAPTMYPEKYSELEAKFKKATVAIEHGKIEKAKELRAELIKDYAALELDSLQANTTLKAKEVIADAEYQEAGKYAPRTLKQAEEELALALNVLSAGRTQTQKARAHADKAVYFANKSIYITETIKDFKRHNLTGEERVLWYQKQLELIHEPFEKRLHLDQSNRHVVMGFQAEINQLIKAKTATEKTSTATSSDVLALQRRIETLKAEHEQEIASLSKKISRSEASMKKQLQDIEEANRKAQARFDKIQSIFTEEEAYVYRQGDNVLLETHAFDFKVGGKEIDSSNFDLLEKIMKAINVFDNPKIIVRGHTDSTGGAALNMKLSRKRAQTVALFLKKIGKIDSGTIAVIGYGETRPVASNETKEGRKRNRRIEVSIVNN